MLENPKGRITKKVESRKVPIKENIENRKNRIKEKTESRIFQKPKSNYRKSRKSNK